MLAFKQNDILNKKDIQENIHTKFEYYQISNKKVYFK